jgi:hypothetical protein
VRNSATQLLDRELQRFFAYLRWNRELDGAMRLEEGTHAEQRVGVRVEALDPDGRAAPDAPQSVAEGGPDVLVFRSLLDVAEDAIEETSLPISVDVNSGSQVFVVIVRPLYGYDADIDRLAVLSKQRGEPVDGPVRDIFEKCDVNAV